MFCFITQEKKIKKKKKSTQPWKKCSDFHWTNRNIKKIFPRIIMHWLSVQIRKFSFLLFFYFFFLFLFCFAILLLDAIYQRKKFFLCVLILYIFRCCCCAFILFYVYFYFFLCSIFKIFWQQKFPEKRLFDVLFNYLFCCYRQFIIANFQLSP